ncbi:hypothetical protein GYB59_20310 [bacterium]|nr:hypothetical protein [bacterium]
MPQDLKEAMRHASINTTLAFYVGDTPEKTSQAMFAALSTGKPTGSDSEGVFKRADYRLNTLRIAERGGFSGGKT